LSKTVHLLVKRTSDQEPIADLIAEKVVRDNKAKVEDVGGEISLSRTYQTNHSYIVVSGLPDSIDIEQLLPGYEVKAVSEDAE